MEELVAAAVQFVAQQFQLVAQVSSDLSGLAEELLSRLAQASSRCPGRFILLQPLERV